MSARAGSRTAWQIQAQDRIDWLRAELHEAAQRQGGSFDPTDNKFNRPGEREPYDAAIDQIAQRLEMAESYLVRLPNVASWLGWLRGTRIEGAWTNIHSAHARLMEVAGDPQVRGAVVDVESAVVAHLQETHPWRRAITAWMAERGSQGQYPITHDDRELLSNALRQAYAANAETYTQLRRFRNILFGTALLFTLLAALFSAIGAFQPSLIPMCFSSSADAEAGKFDAEKSLLVCPTGKRRPSGGDFALVAALGLLGGAVGGTPSLTKSTRATVTAYTLRVARMLLKVSLGAVAAVVGILFLNAGFVPGFGELDSQVQILAYAIVFGASQQVVTRLADQQGERLLKSASAENTSAPGKDSTV